MTALSMGGLSDSIDLKDCVPQTGGTKLTHQNRDLVPCHAKTPEVRAESRGTKAATLFRHEDNSSLEHDMMHHESQWTFRFPCQL